ncbi:unnamed protein product [Phytophthora lilii]|uniref:Unnamed protein product n=1 Tax=Phytophthora lilii TaxID=2077276 RepID=A0A9W6XCW7_9STRA|nr:unnamed protein product [Phytophthora lilii]
MEIADYSKLPIQETLGTWTPLKEEMDILDVNRDLTNSKVKSWLDDVLQIRKKPLSNEEQLQLGDMDADERELLLQLLRTILHS